MNRVEGVRVAGLLTALQYGDSFFPSGAMAFSWGLEALQRDGFVRDMPTLIEYVDAQLLHRWASCDQGLLSAAYKAAAGDNALLAVIEIDALAEAISIVPPLREGSRRLGRTMASVHGKLGNACAAELLALIEARHTPGHLAVVQGYIWAKAGMNALECRAAAAHATCIGAISAAVRLSIVGHLDAQRALASLRERLTEVLESDAPSLDQLSSCAFAIDIAAMRHAQYHARLFAN
jgi:urease accessory protein